jgi:uracil-DNA glycosylase
MNEYWEGRGYPWEYDPGPPKNRRWPCLFAQTPNYRQLGQQVLGRENFRWHFGPMFYRGRLGDNQVRVLVVGQEGAQDESLAHRAFTGGTGARMQNAVSPIARQRHELFNYVLERNDVHLIIAVGRAAKESIVTWVESRGGTCPLGTEDLSQCTGSYLDPRTKIIGVLHPGGAGKADVLDQIKADFTSALAKIRQWVDVDPSWLPPDKDGVRQFDTPYEYKSAPIPFRDFPYGVPLRLGRGGTSSNRQDEQRSIQIFSAGGAYNNRGDSLQYDDLALGILEGYAESPGDVPYEPPKRKYRDYDKGPGRQFARLFMGGQRGLEWPDFNALGVTMHPSLGCGSIYRGRPNKASVLILADQQSHDDLFTGRALTGDSGQHMQAFLESIGVLKAYVIIRILPVDTLDLDADTVSAIVRRPQVQKVYQAIVDRIIASNKDLSLVLSFGPYAHTLLQDLSFGNLPAVKLKAWKDQGALQDWQNHLQALRQINYRREVASPPFAYDGHRGQIPRVDLPYGTVRWVGTCGDRARRPIDLSTQTLSPDYYKIFVPDWVYNLAPLPLSSDEQTAIKDAP